MTQPIWQEIHHFWFKECTADDWFGKSLDFDRLIWQRFGLWCEAAARGECYDWRHNLTGRLTEIVVLDQFSRNVWRDSPRAFSQDGMALVLAQEAVHHPDYPNLSQRERQFILMPYMHSESPLIHEQAVRLFTELGDEQTLDYEFRHKAIIDRFGRYPHRNKILGRPSTPEEVEFLKLPGSSF